MNSKLQNPARSKSGWHPGVDGVRWKVYLYFGVILCEALCIAVFLIFGLVLLEPMLLGDAQLSVTLDWYLMSRTQPWTFALIGVAGLAAGFSFELLRRWLKRRWENDLGMHVVK
jgi:hypothetical protein